MVEDDDMEDEEYLTKDSAVGTVQSLDSISDVVKLPRGVIVRSWIKGGGMHSIYLTDSEYFKKDHKSVGD
jgi:hypothetical protein